MNLNQICKFSCTRERKNGYIIFKGNTFQRAHAEALRHDAVTVQEDIPIAGGWYIMLAVDPVVVGFCIGGDEHSVRGVGQYSNECRI